MGAAASLCLQPSGLVPTAPGNTHAPWAPQGSGARACGLWTPSGGSEREAGKQGRLGRCPASGHPTQRPSPREGRQVVGNVPAALACVSFPFNRKETEVQPRGRWASRPQGRSEPGDIRIQTTGIYVRDTALQ